MFASGIASWRGSTILVIGATGQVGHELAQTLGSLGARVVLGLRRNPSGKYLGLPAIEMDLENLSQVAESLRALHPDLIINAAAYTQVDKAEVDESRARCVNADAVAVMAAHTKASGGGLIHFSTDYVYGATHDRAIREDEPLAPLNAYGRTKAAGEQVIQDMKIPAVILRSSWVYGLHGSNFIKTMLRLGSERETLRVVSDQHGAPTWARHLATATLQILLACRSPERIDSVTGVYNLCAGGVTNWADFARLIFDQARARGVALKVASVESIASAEYPTPAQRPPNSRLDLTKIGATFGIYPPPWQQGVEQFLEALLPLPYSSS